MDPILSDLPPKPIVIQHDDPFVNSFCLATIAAARVERRAAEYRERRTKFQQQEDNSKSLLFIFKALATKGLSLREFLSKSFNSEHEEIRSKVNQFCATDGPAAVLHHWGMKLEGGKYDSSFAKEAIEIVGKRVQADLKNASKDATFRFPAKKVSRKNVEAFSLDRMRASLANSAPNLTHLLKLMTPTTEEKGLWKPYPENRRPRDIESTDPIPPRMAPRAAWLSVSNLDPDSDEALELSSDSGSDSDLLNIRWHREEQDSEWEDDERKPSPSPFEDQRSFIVTVGCMLVFMKNQQSNRLQMMIGLYLRGLTAPKRLIHLLSKMGLSVSYPTSTACLKSLALDKIITVRRVARKKQVYFLYDNFNRKVTHRHQRTDNQDFFENATTGTIVVGEQLGEERLPDDPPVKPSVTNVAISRKDAFHFNHVFRFHFFDNLLGYKFHQLFRSTFKIPAIKQLVPKRTEAYELAAMDIDQSTVGGNIQVLDNMRQTLNLSKGYFKNLKMIIAGDHLTISRVQSAQKRNICEATYFDQMRWAIPVLQLFHMEMLLCSTILNTHYGSVNTPGSLAYFIPVLKRRTLSREMPCYYTADEFLRTLFRAMCSQLWRKKMETYVRDHGEMSDETMKQEINITILQLTLPGETLFDNFSTTNANAMLFMRDMAVYLEFCAAIKSGDIGRLEEILKWITIMFQAGNHNNYALELLRFGYYAQHKWGIARKEAVFSSLLMNTKGLKNHWLPSDLYQEHNNLLTKSTHATVGNKWSAMSYTTPNIRLFQEVSSQLESEFKMAKTSSFHRSTSTDKDATLVLRLLDEHHILSEASHPSEHQIHPYATTQALNLVTEGTIKLVGGGYRKFIERMEEENADEALAKHRDIEKLMRQLDEETQQARNSLDTAFE